MHKIKALIKQWVYWNAKSAVVKKANIKKMQKGKSISKCSANAKFLFWCSKSDQKLILN